MLNITNSSRGIQHAWHFWYALVFVLKCYAVNIGIACFTP
ncbi:DUF3265 domain-containing protein [Vibrio parahaemolyticus]|nr:DUF3265 domain-containing protein [Vibrio parahaemolyticus]EGU0168929.1 DUF3265 domain-containing protein [Vibrio parahaemolyticus]EIA1497062.1 DUF3265 domain-containing protein [Vibrio parahaemolyticus]EIZ9933144.1 DUF3265 domain-containing protein [Vibrio parahaemolyticus]ELA7323048.1 DUF3265 domain-containing protein [Vibrio parahaemolyticus]MBE3803117.1 DUF3265 domain-containing protein [Vibrio parahaemolyticus]